MIGPGASLRWTCPARYQNTKLESPPEETIMAAGPNDTRNLELATIALKACCAEHPEVTGVTLTMNGGAKNYTFTPTGAPLTPYAQLAERLILVCQGNGDGGGLA
jgi:hypothetical protein